MPIYHTCFMNTPAERSQCHIQCHHRKSWQLGFDLGLFVDFEPSDLGYLKDYLDLHDYAYGENITRKKAYDMVTRCQRGLLLYRIYSNAELRTFINSRRIPITGNISRMSSRQLIKCLETADDNPTFPLFNKLPPELRAMVYEKCFEPVQSRSLTFAAPPILMVNKKVNGESKGLFAMYKSRR